MPKKQKEPPITWKTRHISKVTRLGYALCERLPGWGNKTTEKVPQGYQAGVRRNVKNYRTTRCKIRLQKNAAKKAAVAAYIMIYTMGRVEVTWLGYALRERLPGWGARWLPGWGTRCVKNMTKICVGRPAGESATWGWSRRAARKGSAGNARAMILI